MVLNRFYREKDSDVILRLSAMEAKALRNQLRGIVDPPAIVPRVVELLGEQIKIAEA